MFGEDRRHPLAILHALARHRHQKLQGHLRRDLPCSHLLLERCGQNLHQREPPRHPAHAAIESSRQLVQPVAEALLQLRQQPAHLQRRLVFGDAQRAVQQHGLRLAHRPHHCFHRVPAQLFQRRHSLIAVDDHVAVGMAFGCYHHDGRLLPTVSQGRQEPPLSCGMPDSQVLPSPVELVKLQLHQTR
jgi:hypothetical protein